MDDSSNLALTKQSPSPVIGLTGSLNRRQYAFCVFAFGLMGVAILVGLPRVVGWVATSGLWSLHEEALLWHSPYVMSIQNPAVGRMEPRQYDMAHEIGLSLDRDVDPCDDFFLFVCGRWSRSHPGVASEFTRLQGELLASAIHKMVRGKRKSREAMSASDYAGEAVRQCLLVHVKKEEDFGPFRDLVRSLSFHWPSVEERLDLDLLDLAVTTALEWGISTLFEVEAVTDLRTDNSTLLRVTGSLHLSHWMTRWFQNSTDSLAMFRIPSYIDPTVNYKALLHRIMEPSVQTLLHLLAGRHDDAEPAYIKIKDITNLSRGTLTTERWLSTVNKHLPPHAQLQPESEMHLLDHSYIWHIGQFIYKFEMGQTQSDVAVMVGWVLANHLGLAMSHRIFSQTAYSFSMALYYCINLVQEMAPYPLAWFMTEDYVRQKEWDKSRVLLEDVRSAMADAFDWMDNRSRWFALKRLNLIRQVVAYPRTVSTKTLLDGRYAYLKRTVKGKFVRSYLDTKRLARKARNALLGSSGIPRQEDDALAVPVVNAMFVPFYHTVIIPTSMMLPPFMIPHLPAASYGGLGHVIAHELSHAFDVEGAVMDADGLQREWYTKQTLSRMEDNERCLRQLYDVPGNVSWNTENEDFADALGIKVVSQAVERRFDPDTFSGVEGFSNIQLFFVSSCFKWCSASSEQTETTQDTHSGMRRRCNAPLHGHQRFLDAFMCGHKALMRPKRPCRFA